MKKKLTKKPLLLSLVLSVVMIASMGLAAFAESGVVNLLPYPNGQFNKLVKYDNGKINTETVSVQGADENYKPFNFSNADEAMAVKFTGMDGVKASAKNTVENQDGVLTANNKVTIPGGLDYGPVRVQAKLPNASGWTGSIDLGLVLNPKGQTQASGATVELYKGKPSKSTEMAKYKVGSIGPKVVKSAVNYPSALDALVSVVEKIDKDGKDFNVYAKGIKIKGQPMLVNDYPNDKAWYYGVYDSNGKIKEVSKHVGAEVMNFRPGDRIVFIYGAFGDLPDQLEK